MKIRRLICLLLVITMVAMCGGVSNALEIKIKLTKTYQNLYPGDKSEKVKELQERLIELYYLDDGQTDGIYGRKTARAVHYFKLKHFSSCSCSSPDKCVATVEMQKMLFSSEAMYYTGSHMEDEEESSSTSSSSKSSGSRTCTLCDGLRYCKFCVGFGYKVNYFTGDSYTCTGCYGTGRCSFCLGTGYN